MPFKAYMYANKKSPSTNIVKDGLFKNIIYSIYTNYCKILTDSILKTTDYS